MARKKKNNFGFLFPNNWKLQFLEMEKPVKKKKKR